MDMKFLFTFCLCILVSKICCVTEDNECPALEEICEEWDEDSTLEQLIQQFGDDCPDSLYMDLLHPDICFNLDDLEPPEPVDVTFISKPENRTVSGGSVELLCMTNPPALYTYWFFNGRRIAKMNNPFSSGITISDGEVDKEKKLFISTAGPGYYGKYTCEVVTVNGIAETSAWITGPNNAACSLDFAKAPENAVVKQNGHVVLRCEAMHFHGEYTVTWYKQTNSGRRRNINKQHVASIPEGLHFRSAKRGDQGTYVCEIRDSTGCTKTASAKLTVYTHVWEVCGTTPLNDSQQLIYILSHHAITEEKVRHGSEARLGSAPWMVSIQHSTAGHLCGGVLLNTYWVATAAHCFVPNQGSRVYRLNQHNTLLKFGKHAIKATRDRGGSYTPHEQHEQVRHYRKRVVHPYFSRRGRGVVKFDIALVKLRSAVHFNDHVRPLCLPIGEEELPDRSQTGKKGLVTGWGGTERGSALSNVLQEIAVPIQSPETCFDSEDMNASMFCAGEGYLDTPDACKGDSGGPFAVPVNKSGSATKWYLTGLVSHGPRCKSSGGTGRQFGYYTNVTAVLNWIRWELADRRN